MTTETIFGDAGTTIPTPPPSTPPTTTVLPPEVTEIVGAGKKYATVEEALKSVPHAQQHIAKLEEETAKLKEELTKRQTAAELLEEIKQGVIKPVVTTTSVTPPVEEIQQIVQKTLEQREIISTHENNKNKVVEAFSVKYGDKAEETYNSIAKEAGMRIEDLNILSRTHPSAVLKLAGLDMKQTNTSVAKPSVTTNTERFNTDNGQNNGNTTSRVKSGASTKDLVSAWKIAGQKVGKPA